MIALYKFTQTTELDQLLLELGYQTARFYSVKSLLDQIMNPMVILTPSMYKNEVESLPVPVIPVAIHLADIVRTIEQYRLQTPPNEPYRVIASEEELDWLQREYREDPQIPICFLSMEQFLPDDLQTDHIHLIPEPPS